MELGNFIDVDVETSEKFEEHDFSIDAESLGILFKGFSDSLYSNKIGSIVREITSNCFDSHIEAGQTKPVIIHINNDLLESGNSITFTDFGVGLSPERIQKIYSKYFSSTKRGSNDEIGGFGIGAKSPLSYTNIFTVVTRVNKVEYTYMVHRGESVPKIQLVDKKTTEHGNGTAVTIGIKTSTDMSAFKRELRHQLRYFDNIEYYNCDIDNDYKIIQGKHFMYRPDNENTNDFNKMHIVVGKVPYPLNYSVITLDSDEQEWNNAEFFYSQSELEIPIALRFKIGEIPVTMNRESLEYKPEVIKLIRQRIDEVREELTVMRDAQDEWTDDFGEYLKKRSIKGLLDLTPEISLNLQDFIEGKSMKFKPFEGMNIAVPDNPFFMLEIRGKVLTNGAKDETLTTKGTLITKLLAEGALIYRTNIPLTKRKNMYVCEIEGNRHFYAVALEKYTVDAISLRLKCNMIAAEAFYNEILRYFIKMSKSYDKVVVPDIWLKNYLQNLKVNQIYESKETFTMREFNTGYYLSDTYKLKTVDMKFSINERLPMDVKKINDRGTTIIYGGQDDSTRLAMVGIFLLLESYRTINKTNLNPMHVIVCKVAQANFKYMTPLNHAIHINDFETRFITTIKRIVCRFNLYKDLSQFNTIQNTHIIPLLPGVEEIINKYDSFINGVNSKIADILIQYGTSAIDPLLNYFGDDIDYRWFVKGEKRGNDIYQNYLLLKKRLEPLAFMRYLDVDKEAASDPVYMSHLKKYLVQNKIIHKSF